MAVQTQAQKVILEEERRLHSISDPHGRMSSLADMILGGQDGLVNVLGIVLGVAVASNDPRLVLTAGLAAAFAESVSMAAVAYTSTLAQADFYESERSREYRHIEKFPNQEEDEIRWIFQSKGFEGELLDQVVEKITSDRETWVKIMLAEEHQLSPVDRKGALKTALVVGLSAIVGSIIPLLPFIFFGLTMSIWLSLAISTVTLFLVGVYKSRVSTVGRPARSGIEMALIGMVSALIGYGIGSLLTL